tara:strand:+ start:3815 stop:4363 length:549 start_codon:yes stop_codon:yes gene_type:complete
MSITINGNGTVTGLSALPASAMSTGSIIQVVSTTKTDTTTETLAANAVSANDIGGLQVTITPSSSSNKIILTCSLTMSSYDNGFLFYKDGSVISGALGDADGSRQRVFAEQYLGSGYTMFNCTHHYMDTAGGTSAITYGIRVKNTHNTSRTYDVNKSQQGRTSFLGADLVGASTFTAMEIKA